MPAVVDAAQMYMKERLDDRPGIGWNFVAFQGFEWLFLGALTPITYYMARRFPLHAGRWRRTIPAHIGGALMLCLSWTALGVALGHIVNMGRYAGHSIATEYTFWMLTSLPWSLFMYFAVLGSVYAFWYFREARERENQAARLSAQLSESRLDALRMQLNPHFLFNSLNAVTVLVRQQNSRAASRTLELLSDLLRQVLRTDQPHQIPLSDELQFVQQYLAIEEVRFSDRLRVHWSIDDAARDALVPGFILQPLVENAIRHGVARRADAGRIDISAQVVGDALHLIIRDDGTAADDRGGTGGVGLANTRERLRTLHADRATLSLRTVNGGTEVKITMPYRRSGDQP